MATNATTPTPPPPTPSISRCLFIPPPSEDNTPFTSIQKSQIRLCGRAGVRRQGSGYFFFYSSPGFLECCRTSWFFWYGFASPSGTGLPVELDFDCWLSGSGSTSPLGLKLSHFVGKLQPKPALSFSEEGKGNSGCPCRKKRSFNLHHRAKYSFHCDVVICSLTPLWTSLGRESLYWYFWFSSGSVTNFGSDQSLFNKSSCFKQLSKYFRLTCNISFSSSFSVPLLFLYYHLKAPLVRLTPMRKWKQQRSTWTHC